MSPCVACGASFPANVSHCPYCRTPRPKDSSIRIEILHPQKKNAPNACPVCQRAESARSVSAIINQQTRTSTGRTHSNNVENNHRRHERTDERGARVVESTQSTIQNATTTGTFSEEKSRIAEMLQCPDFAPPSAAGRFGKFFFGEERWRLYRLRARRWMAHLQPFMGAVIGAYFGVALVSFLLVVLHLDYDNDPLLNSTALGYLISIAIIGATFLFGFAGFSLFRFLAPKWQSAFEHRLHDEILSEPARRKWEMLYYCEQDDVVYLPGGELHAKPGEIKEFCLNAAAREDVNGGNLWSRSTHT